jgi:hypothetical protein
MVKPKKDKLASEAFVLAVAGHTEKILMARINGLEKRVEKQFTESDEKHDRRYDKIMNSLDWLVGAYKKFDEEHTILSGRVSDHTDRIEELERSVFKTS